MTTQGKCRRSVVQSTSVLLEIERGMELIILAIVAKSRAEDSFNITNILDERHIGHKQHVLKYYS